MIIREQQIFRKIDTLTKWAKKMKKRDKVYPPQAKLLKPPAGAVPKVNSKRDKRKKRVLCKGEVETTFNCIDDIMGTSV